VLVLAGSPVAVAAKQATSATPLVKLGVANPVRTGLIESFARPGGNLIGTRLFNANLRQIAELALENQLPSTATQRHFAEYGGLMSHGARTAELYRRGAYFVDKILKGARPAELPVEQPSTFDFVLNMQTARALGLTVPASARAAATEIIE
jgi:ABC-type uncharacterized transport system substrate-binding protein